MTFVQVTDAHPHDGNVPRTDIASVLRRLIATRTKTYIILTYITRVIINNDTNHYYYHYYYCYYLYTISYRDVSVILLLWCNNILARAVFTDTCVYAHRKVRQHKIITRTLWILLLYTVAFPLGLTVKSDFEHHGSCRPV